MRHAFQFGLALGALLSMSVFATPAEAQHMGAGAARPMGTMARPMGMQMRPTYSRRFVPRQMPGSAPHANYGPGFAGGFGGYGGSGMTLQQLLDPVPPPGFDYQYLSAIDSDLGIKAFIDPATQYRLAAAERYLRGTGFAGGAYLFDGGGYYYLPTESDQGEEGAAAQPAQPQPQIIVLQQAPPAQASSQQAETAPEVAQQAPLPDVGEFTLVLRDGTRIQAVAFTSSNDKIVYITADGSRRTIAAADLDANATVQVNQERGTPLQLPL